MENDRQPREDAWNPKRQTRQDSGWNPTGEIQPQPQPGATNTWNADTDLESQRQGITNTRNPVTHQEQPQGTDTYLNAGPDPEPERQGITNTWNETTQQEEPRPQAMNHQYTTDRQMEPQWQARENSAHTDEDMQPHRSSADNSPQMAYPSEPYGQPLQQPGWETSRGGDVSVDTASDMDMQRGRDDAGSDDMTPHGPRRRHDSPDTNEWPLGREPDPDNWSGSRTLPRSSKEQERHTFEPD